MAKRIPARMALAAALLFVGGIASAQQALTLDEVIVLAGKGIEEKVKSGSNLAVLNFTSGSDMFSDYVIEELTGLLVMSGKLSVIERRSLDLVRQEAHFQLSGDVSDDLAMSIGKQVGAQGIVTGALQDQGASYRFRIKVINVESARIEAQFSYNLRKDGRTAFFLQGGQGGVQSTGAPSSGTQASGSGQSGSAPARTPAAAAPATAQGMTRAGLYSGAAFQGAMDLYAALDWLAANVQDKGNYTIVLDKDQSMDPTEFAYPNKTVNITLRCAGGKYKVTFAGKSPAYSLFTIRGGVTLTLEEGISLEGTQNDANKSLIHIAGGTVALNGVTLTGNKTTGNGGAVYMASGKLTMNNSTITKNTANGGWGGGVYVAAGTFTMDNSTISGNSSSNNGYGGGGGVCVASGAFTLNNSTISGNSSSTQYGYGGGGIYVKGTFTMNGGAISGNSASVSWSGGCGGGVFVEGRFTMTGGAVSGNTAPVGGGVYVVGTFTKSGGIIHGSNAQEDGQANRAGRGDGRGHAVALGDGGSNISKKRDPTAREALVMDSEKTGPAGGWE